MSDRTKAPAGFLLRTAGNMTSFSSESWTAWMYQTPYAWGERTCPPEDVGGPSGYMDCLEALRDSSHPDHREMVECRGPSFNPDWFDPARINRRLHQLSRSRRRG